MKTRKLFAAAFVLLLASCQKEEFNKSSVDSSGSVTKEMIAENGNNPDETMLTDKSGNGHVYIQSNDAKQNAVIMYNQNDNGSLTWHSTTMSGGKGAGEGLGSQGSVVMDEYHHWLFAVNAGSNSISSFKVNYDGSLELMQTVSSGGEFPVSVCVYKNLVYAVNGTSADIYGYRIKDDGHLVAIDGSHQKLSAKEAAPAQISFDTYGKSLIVTEKMTNMITTFALMPSGAAKEGIFTPSVGVLPFGFDFARDKYMIVSNASGGAENESTCTSYEGFLHPQARNGAVPDYQTAACWVSTSKHGRFAFVTNTGSDNITSYYISYYGTIYFLSWSITPTGAAPIDLSVSGDNLYVYCINSGSHTISEFKRTKYGTLSSLSNAGSVLTVPEFAVGMVAY